MFNYQILFLLKDYLSKKDYLNLINLSKQTRKYEQLFINEFNYSIDICKINRIDLLFNKKYFDYLNSYMLKCNKIINYNKEIFNNDLLNLRKVIFDDKFNTIINKFPDTLTHVIFGDSFNQPIKHLPSSLNYLRFGNDFNNTIDYFPETLETLIFGARFNLHIDKFPEMLNEIEFGRNYDQPLDNIPKTLKYLSLYNYEKDLSMVSVDTIEISQYIITERGYTGKNYKDFLGCKNIIIKTYGLGESIDNYAYDEIKKMCKINNINLSRRWSSNIPKHIRNRWY